MQIDKVQKAIDLLDRHNCVSKRIKLTPDQIQDIATDFARYGREKRISEILFKSLLVTQIERLSNDYEDFDTELYTDTAVSVWVYLGLK